VFYITIYRVFTPPIKLFRKTFKNCGILSCGLLEEVHPYGVIERYHDYVIFDFNIEVIYEV